MPVNLTDVVEFTAPIVGPADADPQAAASYLTGYQGLANRTRWLANLIGGAAGDGEWAYPVVRVRAINISPVGTVVSGASKIVGGAAAGVLTQGQSLNDGWRVHEASLFGGGPGGTDTYSVGHFLRTGLPQHAGYLNLDAYLRTGMTIKSVIVAVDPGTAQATASDRMAFTLYRRNLGAFAAAVAVASGSAANSAAQQYMMATGLTELVDKQTYSYWLVIQSSAGADTTPDDLYGVTLAVDDAGPRNT